MRRLITIALISAAITTAQAKTCTRFDIEVGHRVPASCAPAQPSRVKRAAAKVHRALTVTGEVAIAAAIVGAFVYLDGRSNGKPAK